MKEEWNFEIEWTRVCILSLLSGLSLFVVLACAGCLPSDCAAQLRLRGKVLDQDTLDGLSDAVLGGRSFTGGAETGYFPPFDWLGLPNGPSPAPDGTFQALFSTGITPCSELAPFPRPDRIEIIVARHECTQSFMIEINDETAIVVDEEDPYNVVVELVDPILVPPCEE